MPWGFLIREDTLENMHVHLCQAKLRQEGACRWQHGASRTSNVRKSQLVLGLTRMRGSAAAPASLVVCQWPGCHMLYGVHAHGGRAMLHTVQAGYARMRGHSNMSTALTCISRACTAEHTRPARAPSWSCHCSSTHLGESLATLTWQASLSRRLRKQGRAGAGAQSAHAGSSTSGSGAVLQLRGRS